MVRDRGLEQVARTVELVPLGEVGPAPARLRHLVVGVQVAVLALRGADDVDDGRHVGQEPVTRDAGVLVGGRLDPLVHVRVHEDRALVAAGGPAGGDAEVLEVPRRLEHPVAVGQGGVTVGRLPPGPQTALDRHGASGERLPQGRRTVGGVGRAGAAGRDSCHLVLQLERVGRFGRGRSQPVKRASGRPRTPGSRARRPPAHGCAASASGDEADRRRRHVQHREVRSAEGRAGGALDRQAHHALRAPGGIVPRQLPPVPVREPHESLGNRRWRRPGRLRRRRASRTRDGSRSPRDRGRNPTPTRFGAWCRRGTWSARRGSSRARSR